MSLKPSVWLMALSALCAPLLATAVESPVGSLSVVQDQDGGPLAEYQYRGRAYVAGERGQPYALALRNPTGAPVLAVISVDGVNVLDGKTAAYSGDGYVIPAYASVRVTGWRKSMDEVARFNFSSSGGSYASRTGRAKDVGVIGAAIFRMKAPPRMPAPSYSRSSASRDSSNEAGGLASAEMMSKQSLGTGHGQREESRVTTVDFKRASSRPDAVLALYYDDFETLVAKGVIARESGPSPFPTESRARWQFVPDPR